MKDLNTSSDAEIVRGVWSSIADVSRIACARATEAKITIYGSCVSDFRKRSTKVSLDLSVEVSGLIWNQDSFGSVQVVAPLSRDLSHALQELLIAAAYLIASKECAPPAGAAHGADSPPAYSSPETCTARKLIAGIAAAFRRLKENLLQ